MRCRCLCVEGRALRRALGVALAVFGLLAAGCKPQFGSFLPANAHFARTFGQLFDDGGGRKISHYVIVKLPPGVIRTFSSGTIEYVPGFNEMGNCLLLRPQTYPISLNDFSNLHGLPSPAAIVLAYCNLEESSVRTAARIAYMHALPLESTSEWNAAADHFIARDEGFLQVDVRSVVTPLPVSDDLGRAIGDELKFAAFKDEGNGVALFVNPLPYLAAAVPALSIDPVAPTIAQIVVQTSESGFLEDDAVNHAVVGGVIANPLPRHALRVAIRSNERTATAGPLVMPYLFKSRLELASGTPLVRSRGAAQFNGFRLQEAAGLTNRAYSTLPPVNSDPAADQYFPFLAWNNARPAPAAGEDFFNALALPGNFALDLNAVAAGPLAFPGGQYRLVVTVADVAQAAVEQTIAFQLEPGLEMQVLQDGNPDDAQFVGDTPVDFLNIGLWDKALDASNILLNGPDPANFVARDRFRFYIRISDPNADTGPGQQTIVAQLGTVRDGSAAMADDFTPVDLVESAAEPGVFVSRAQLLTPKPMVPTSTVCAPADIICEDDLFQVHDGRPGGAVVADEQPGDRTHRAAISDSVRIVYHPVGAVHDQRWIIPVCQRSPDARRKVFLRMTIFDHLDEDEHLQEELDRANLSWAPACIEFVQKESTRFHDAPVNVHGDSIFADQLFSTAIPADPAGDSDEKRVIAAYRNSATADVVEVFVVEDFDIGVAGMADIPRGNHAGLGEKIFLFLREEVPVNKRTLAHELGHALENGDRDAPSNPKSEFYPQKNEITDIRVTESRRVSWETIQLARQTRTSSTGTGNRLMKPY